MMFSVALLGNLRKHLSRNIMKFRSFDLSVSHFNLL